MTEPGLITIRRPTEGRAIGIVGDIYRFLVTGEDTGGRYAMFEATLTAGKKVYWNGISSNCPP